ncbi:MAG: ATP-binding cassette domain-containing protein [Chitinispirillales bacterium]|jgi:oligopeptide/dipeptide ABC transporter ATP-binding protein|nr:ATP-binding cassette domain-containing protein [Chitinispirillales bacterium]
MNKNETCINVRDLKIHFPTRGGLLGKVSGWTKAVDGVSFTVKRGEVFAIVGESGCGKTTAAQAVMGLLRPTSGGIEINTEEGSSSGKNPKIWEKLSAKERKNLRREMQIVFQDPYSSLNPRMTVRSILEEPLIIHGLGSQKEIYARIDELLDQVGLSKSYLERYPHEFSGGQRQRIGIARSLATAPKIIIADEPVSALDVSIQAQIINLLQDMQTKYNQTLLFISHDLAVVRHIANRVAVMYQGKIMETGSDSQIFSSTLHPYTELLLKSVPAINKSKNADNVPVDKCQNESGGILKSENSGCGFYPRCPARAERCRKERPELEDFGNGHLAACFNRRETNGAAPTASLPL